MHVQSINLCWVVVADLEKAIPFYQESLGLKLLEWNKAHGWAEFAGHEGGSRLGVAQASDFNQVSAGSNAVVALNVENIEKAREAYLSKGVTCLGEIMEVPGHVKLLFCQDQDGNKFQLAQLLS